MAVFNYNSAKWRKKQKAILRRDGYMCQWCKRYGKRVEKKRKFFSKICGMMIKREARELLFPGFFCSN